MKFYLEELRVSALLNMEFGQLIRRHQDDLATIDPNLLNDQPYNNYLGRLDDQTNLYEKALAQVRENEETKKIAEADDVRDKAVGAFGAAIKLHAMSDLAEEAEASRSLSIVFGAYKNIAKMNYESETMAIDKLVGELNGPNYIGKINDLHMSKYVARMSDANSAFKNLFGGRMVTTASTEAYDMKVIRTELQEIYSDFCDYVLAMAKATENPLFPAALNLINTARKYYADLLARRTATKPDETKKSN
jgi:hypothetical protein